MPSPSHLAPSRSAGRLRRALPLFASLLLVSGAVAKGPEKPADSQFRQAVALLEGPEAQRNPTEAIRLLTEAAGQGHAEAANRLGYLYDKGVGVAKDAATARSWFEKAAAAGLAKAQLNYGRFLILGQGGSADPAQGLELLGKAAAQDFAPAQVALGEILYFGEYEQKKDYARALPLFLAAGKAGDAKAQNFAGVMYRLGQGVKLNHKEAVQWFARAAEQGHAKAQASLADAYLTGTGIQRDKVQAIKYFMLSADQGEITAVRPLEDLMAGLDPKTLRAATREVAAYRARHPQPKK